MPGFGSCHHQVARHVVAMHVDRRLREVRIQNAPEHGLERVALRRSQIMLQVSGDVPVGEKAQLPPQQRLVVRRQFSGTGRELPAHQRVDGVGK